MVDYKIRLKDIEFNFNKKICRAIKNLIALQIFQYYNCSELIKEYNNLIMPFALTGSAKRPMLNSTHETAAKKGSKQLQSCIHIN